MIDAEGRKNIKIEDTNTAAQKAQGVTSSFGTQTPTHNNQCQSAQRNGSETKLNGDQAVIDSEFQKKCDAQEENKQSKSDNQVSAREEISNSLNNGIGRRRRTRSWWNRWNRNGLLKLTNFLRYGRYIRW